MKKTKKRTKKVKKPPSKAGKKKIRKVKKSKHHIDRKFKVNVKKKTGTRKSTMAATKRRTRKQYSQQTFKKAVFNDQDISSVKIDKYFQYEYLYFRNCEMKVLDVQVNFPHLRVLDVSCNKLTNLHFLQHLPNVRHVFASCNYIGSFHNVTFVNSIETLGMSGNGIKNFEGFEELPNLKVLNIMFNDITDLSDFPALPLLERINMVHNPVCDNDGFKNMLLALTSESSPKLTHINEGKVSDTEKKISTCYTGRVSLCARNGFLPDESEGAKEIEEQVTDFLLETNIAETKGQIMTLLHQEIQGVQAEGMELKYAPYFVIEHPRAALREIPGLKRHNFMVTSGCRQVTLVLNNKIEIPMKKNPKAPKHLIIMLLPPGEYKYHYLYDGRIMSDPSPVTVTPPEMKGPSDIRNYDYVLRMRWLRYDSRTGFAEIEGQDGFSYTTRGKDLGRILRPTLDLFHTRNVESLFEIYDMTKEIRSALPSAENVTIVGDMIEGQTVRASYEYLGGTEGNSKVRIYPEGRSREEEMEEETEGEEDEKNKKKKKHSKLEIVSEYRIRSSDVGKKLVCEVIPIREDGTRGKVVRYFSEEVKAAKPEILNLEVKGSFVQDSELEVTYEYKGGTEGPTEINWYTYDLTTRNYTQKFAEGKKIKILKLCVGRGLRVTVLPASESGLKGDIVERLYADVEIRALEPKINDLKILCSSERSGEDSQMENGNLRMMEGDLLSVHGTYSGGVEGSSSIRWFRTKNPETLEGKSFIPKGTSSQHRLSSGDIGWFIGVEYLPVRQDGVQGVKVAVVEKVKKVEASTPTCLEIKITGEEKCGSMLTCQTKYFGGEEGESSYSWFRITDDGEEVSLGTSRYCMCSFDDENHVVKVNYLPVREDGMKSEVSFSAMTGVIKN